jgi:hypothetical protein
MLAASTALFFTNLPEQEAAHYQTFGKSPLRLTVTAASQCFDAQNFFRDHRGRLHRPHAIFGAGPMRQRK